MGQGASFTQRLMGRAQRRTAAAHRRAIRRALDDPALLERFRERGQLPHGYGIGLNERVVELPWLLTRSLHGRLLDAGSSLNHAEVLERLLPVVDVLQIVTLAPEAHSFTERGVSYLYADLRELPYRDGYFDVLACISTLEHVGMDNSVFGARVATATDPEREAERALVELARVLAPGGSLFITVPYGVAEDRGWMRQYDRRALEAFDRVPGLDRRGLDVFAYDSDGWQFSDLEAAAGARFRHYTHASGPVTDKAAGARAVACLELVRVAPA